MLPTQIGRRLGLQGDPMDQACFTNNNVVTFGVLYNDGGIAANSFLCVFINFPNFGDI